MQEGKQRNGQIQIYDCDFGSIFRMMIENDNVPMRKFFPSLFSRVFEIATEKNMKNVSSKMPIFFPMLCVYAGEPHRYQYASK